MASPTQWAWVWVNSGSWWWTGRPGVPQSWDRRVRQDFVAEQQHDLDVDGSVTGCRNSSQQGFAHLMKRMCPPTPQLNFLTFIWGYPEHMFLSHHTAVDGSKHPPQTPGMLPLGFHAVWSWRPLLKIQSSTLFTWHVGRASFPGRTCLITFKNNHVERLFIVFAVTSLCRGDCQAKIRLRAGR